jgi:hypothetical protein
MINRDEFGVIKSPRPAPICSMNDLFIPTLAVLGVTVLSGSCARLAGGNHAATEQVNMIKIAIIKTFLFEFISTSRTLTKPRLRPHQSAS